MVLDKRQYNLTRSSRSCFAASLNISRCVGKVQKKRTFHGGVISVKRGLILLWGIDLLDMSSTILMFEFLR